MVKVEKFGAFTLAEVLITLGIICIVAAMTVPALINTINDMHYKSAYKKAVSALANAVDLANADNLLVDSPTTTGGTPRPTAFDSNFLSIMSKFSVAKTCSDVGTDYANCWEDSGEKYGGTGTYPSGTVYAFIDNSGMAWCQYWRGALLFFVDTNGFKIPNRWGKDRFVLWAVDQNNQVENSMGMPIKVIPIADNNYVCGSASGNMCYTTHDYYGTSWLLNK